MPWGPFRPQSQRKPIFISAHAVWIEMAIPIVVEGNYLGGFWAASSAAKDALETVRANRTDC